MKTLLIHTLLGFGAACAGAVSVLMFRPDAVRPAFHFDVGKVPLHTATRLLIPVVNSSGEPLRLNGITTSCGCAHALVSSLEIAGGEAGFVPVELFPRSPDRSVDFVLKYLANGVASKSATVRGEVRSPFDGYPFQARGSRGPRGVTIRLDSEGAGFVGRVEAWKESKAADDQTPARLPCEWRDELGLVEVDGQPESGSVQIVIFDKRTELPAWSGPLVFETQAVPASLREQ